jgi:pimeloyl-ACP methyl ester carboxylesterase
MAAPAEWPMSLTRSTDDAPISYRTVASRADEPPMPGLIIVPGNNRRAHHYDELAIALSADFAVHTLDRRGRGESAPQGDHYTVDLEADDVLAVAAATGSRLLFGHSYGGLIALRVAVRGGVERLSAHEPGVSLNGEFDLDWLDEFNRLYYRGRRVAAMSLFLRRSKIVPIGNAPQIVFRLLATLLLFGGDGKETRALMATSPRELGELLRTDSDGSEYSAISAPMLLLARTRTNPYLTKAVLRLGTIIPGATAEVIEGLDHNAPDLSSPVLIASHLRGFFGAAV